jgi:histidinol-phosphatase (PHP family)
VYSDGYAQPPEYVKAAIDKGFGLLGFSEHSPLQFANSFSFHIENLEKYLNLIKELKITYRDSLSIFSAMEVDFIPGMSTDFDAVRQQFQSDYLIGSVHLVKPDSFEELWFTDGPDYRTYDEGLNNFFGGDIRKAVTTYYRQVNQMIETQRFEIIGHFDKIKMHNRDRFFREDETWYRSLVAETLNFIREKDLIVEINTRGIYKKRSNTTYPGLEILKKLKNLGIPVMINSDAHKPDELDGAFDVAELLCRQAGISETVFFTAGGWKFQSLEKETARR